MRSGLDIARGSIAASPNSSRHGSRHGGSAHGYGSYQAATVLLRLLARHGALAHRGPVRPRQHALVQASAHGSQHGAAPHLHHLSSRPVSALSAALLVAQPETAAQQAAALDLGFPRDLQAHYIVEDKLLGKGGNGTVSVVTHRESGDQRACKRVPKVLELGPLVTERKRAGHLDSLKREISTLQKLKGCLNVVELHDVFEDDEYVYIVMETCAGGELHDRIGEAHYSERTVASYMRGVLRTLAVMHSHHILHRDIKPSNFMLLNDSERAPLKAIDFGLAMPYEPEALPLSHLGLEGTPWYMAPESLSSQVLPASDVWSAGVMAFQLLTGHLPFDDKRNPAAPAVGAIWKSVLTDPLDFTKPWWNDISEEAKDFVSRLLERDPERRPTAKQALEHPWLRGTSRERSTGKSLDRSVVQRIQRFSQAGLFKRLILQAITENLMHQSDDESAAHTSNSQQQQQQQQQQVSHRGTAILDSPMAPALEPLYKKLDLDEGESVSTQQLADRLKAMGFKLEPCEMERLLEQLDIAQEGEVNKATFAASQLDWREVQRSKQWMELVQRAFSALDQDKDGLLDAEDIAAALAAKVPRSEMDAAVAQALQDAGVLQGSAPVLIGGVGLGATAAAFGTSLGSSSNPSFHGPGSLSSSMHHGRAFGSGGSVDYDYPVGAMGMGGTAMGIAGSIDFPHFVELLRMGSLDSLDQYDPRFGSDNDSTHHSRVGGSSTHHRPGGATVSRLGELLQRGAGNGSAAAAATPSLAAAAAAAAASGASSFFRFDVGHSAAATTTATPYPKTFDSSNPSPAAAGAPLASAPAPPPKETPFRFALDFAVPSSVAAAASVPESRHHGSSLYLNQVLGRATAGAAAGVPVCAGVGGRRLEPVAE